MAAANGKRGAKPVKTEVYHLKDFFDQSSFVLQSKFWGKKDGDYKHFNNE